MIRVMRWLAVAILVWIPAGCTLVGRAAPEARPAAGPGAGAEEGPTAPESSARRVYGGSVTLAGDRFALTLELVADGDGFAARLSIPDLSLDAGGEGRVEDGTLKLELRYPGTCPGRMVLEGRFEQEARRLEGRLTAGDCTGEESGAVVLLLRPAGHDTSGPPQ